MARISCRPWHGSCSPISIGACASSTKIGAYDKRIEQMARASETAQRLMKLEGVGALTATATAIVAAAGDGKQFANGRQFAAWLGLVPREYSSGREVRRGRISKRGDAHLRTLLIHGVRVIYRYLGERAGRKRLCLHQLAERRGTDKAIVSISQTIPNAVLMLARMANNQLPHGSYPLLPDNYARLFGARQRTAYRP